MKLVAALGMLKHDEKGMVFRDSNPNTFFVVTGSNPHVIPARSQSNRRVFIRY